jgi:hypothetical protein
MLINSKNKYHGRLELHRFSTWNLMQRINMELNDGVDEITHQDPSGL